MSDQNDPDRPSLRREWKGDTEPDGFDTTYTPDEIEATRARMQGQGVGLTELQQQRDPTRSTTEAEFRERSQTTPDDRPSDDADRSTAERGGLKH